MESFGMSTPLGLARAGKSLTGAVAGVGPFVLQENEFSVAKARIFKLVGRLRISWFHVGIPTKLAECTGIDKSWTGIATKLVTH
jgi:hypothetical protein